MEYSQLSFLESLQEFPKSLAKEMLPKSVFTPPTLDNALDVHKVQDHAILWIRSLVKKNKNSPRIFLLHQINEVKFKKSEYDQNSLVRRSVIRDLIPS